MKTRRRAPGHPGRILKRQFMAPLKLNVTELARALGVSRKTISKIVNERGALSAEMALRLSKAFGTTPQLWLNLQQNFDLWHAAREFNSWRKIERIAA